METDDPALFDAWRSRWQDLCEFEIVAVITSAEAARRVNISWGAHQPIMPRRGDRRRQCR